MLSMVEYSGNSVFKITKSLNIQCFIMKFIGYGSFDIVAEFSEDTNSLLCDELKKIRYDTAYLSELLAEFGELNLKVQGNEVNLITAYMLISKLTLFKIFSLLFRPLKYNVQAC